MSINLALVDAANNCVRVHAKAVITLHSGIQYEGELEREKVDMGTVSVNTKKGGWVVIDKEQIAAVESKPG